MELTFGCIPCNKKCLNCQGVNNCIDGCSDNTRNFTDSCNCNNNKYSLVKDETCDQSCPHKCGNCEEITGSCITCSDTNRILSNSCKCKDGYFDNGNAICASTLKFIYISYYYLLN